MDTSKVKVNVSVATNIWLIGGLFTLGYVMYPSMKWWELVVTMILWPLVLGIACRGGL